jgi:hypothetical protein
MKSASLRMRIDSLMRITLPVVVETTRCVLGVSRFRAVAACKAFVAPAFSCRGRFRRWHNRWERRTY